MNGEYTPPPPNHWYTGDLDKLKAAAELLDAAGYEILAEQIWFAFEQNGGSR